MTKNDPGSTQIMGSMSNGTGNINTFLHVNNALVRAGLSHILAGTCFTVVDAPESVPALCLIDASEPSEHVLEAVRTIRSQHPLCKVALIGGHSDLEPVLAASSAGVDGFCSATSSREVLIKSLELIMLGEKMLPSALVQTLLSQASLKHPPISSPAIDHFTDPRVQKLSPREKVILQAIMGGDANKVIARKLDVAEATVKVHVKGILRKLGAANRTQAAMWAAGNLSGDEPSVSTIRSGGSLN
jgi:two-component system, NarL family, nitrate/nitrite response regulator NarL